MGIGAVYKEDITDYLRWFAGVEGLGPNGPALFMALYVLLEAQGAAIPPPCPRRHLRPAQGTAIVSVSGTIAATASFLSHGTRCATA